MMKNESTHGFIISGTNSNVGKTTITLGIMNIFKDVAPFKVGPDFIDPQFHEFATDAPSYNLDLFLMGEKGVKYSFYTHMKKVNIVEGVMGLYDGLGHSIENYSTNHLSKVLNLPIILIVDGKSKDFSIVAEILGYKNLDSRSKILGVFLNRINSEKRYKELKESIKKFTNLEVVGYLPEIEELKIESRHLGLVQAQEILGIKDKINMISQEIKKSLNTEFILENCKISRENYYEKDNFENHLEILKKNHKGKKIGVARDEAFSFYYKDNLELLKKIGLEIIYFSPIRDREIPNVDILYFGGGYPENYLEELSGNKSMITSIRNFYSSNKVVFGECGGFIYLSKGIYTLDKKFYPLCSLNDATMEMFNRLDIGRFGYIDIDYTTKSGEVIKGKAHEFHYSKIIDAGEMERVFQIRKKDGRGWRCGYSDKNLICGYPHLHFFTNLEILNSILKGVENV